MAEATIQTAIFTSQASRLRSGAFLFTPTRFFHSLGGFSRHFSPAYYEDTDYCLTVWQKGLRVISKTL